MKFESTTEQLFIATSIATRFIERRANLPVLSSVLITAKGGRVILRATNLECGVEVTISTKVVEEGVVAVSGATLSAFLNTIRGKAVTISLVGGVLKVEGERASASIKTIPHDDFPILPQVSASTSFTTKTNDLYKALKSVLYCASTSTIKPELQGVLLFAEAGKLVAAATDSFRLAEKTTPLRSGGSVPQLLIPARNAAELMRLIEQKNEDIELYYNENQLSTHVGEVYYTSRLLDGTFPDYRQIIPKTFSTEVLLLKEDIAQALKALSVFSDKFAQVSFVIEPSKKIVLLSSRNPDVGEETSTLKATISGAGATMNFNGKYLSDSLQAIIGESVRIQSNGPGKPILIKDASDDSFFYLAMPMNR